MFWHLSVHPSVCLFGNSHGDYIFIYLLYCCIFFKLSTCTNVCQIWVDSVFCPTRVEHFVEIICPQPVSEHHAARPSSIYLNFSLTLIWKFSWKQWMTCCISEWRYPSRWLEATEVHVENKAIQHIVLLTHLVFCANWTISTWKGFQKGIKKRIKTVYGCKNCNKHLGSEQCFKSFHLENTF